MPSRPSPSAPTMSEPDRPADSRFLLPAADLGALLRLLDGDGWAVWGPQVRDGGIVIDRLDDAASLPWGWTEEQDGGHFRLARRGDDAVFGFAHGADSWKKLLHPARLRLWRAERAADGFTVLPEPDPDRPPALFGVRGCDLAAIAIQDRVLTEGEHADATYLARRTDALIVAVDCAVPGGTCFCVSMGTGPAAGPGFDLALAELAEPGAHRFVVRLGSARGRDLVERMGLAMASTEERAKAEASVAAAAGHMGRRLDPERARTVLLAGRESPHWEAVAERCLTCGNCTMACPTCFCTSVEDTSDLSGAVAERWRRWESCFTLDFSYVNGGSVRESAGARYRHWISHKLATWHDQFGTAGCVGCGRCITWCPVGIDITAEIAALDARETRP